VRVGIAHHLGWAVAITACGHEVVDRRRIELIEPGMPTAPIEHEARTLDDDAARMVAQARASVEVAAKRVAVANMTAMTAMSGAMPCCSDGQMKGGCPDCPLVAMCMLIVALAEPSLTNGIQIFFEPRRLSFALEDITADGLVGVPPDHPPRILT